jgi:hypothetical protein
VRITKRQLRRVICESLTELYDADVISEPAPFEGAEQSLRGALDDYVDGTSRDGRDVGGALDRLSASVTRWIEDERLLLRADY